MTKESKWQNVYLKRVNPAFFQKNKTDNKMKKMLRKSLQGSNTII